MKVLRQTSHGIAKSQLAERNKQKAEKKALNKAKNVNFVQQKLRDARNEQKHNVRKRIQQMRKEGVFPQPKSYTNYKKRNGLLGINKILIELINIKV